MNILILSPHFWPENFPINTITKHLLKKNNVKVITSIPHYPKQKVLKGYKKKFFVKKYKNLTIIRIPVLIRTKPNFFFIILNYLSFNVSFFYFRKKIIQELGEVETILSYGISPVTSSIPGIFLKKFYKCKFQIWIQDMWPESVRSTGYIKNKFIYYLIEKISNKIYASADKLLVQSKGFKKILKKRNFKNIKVFYNCLESPKFKRPKKCKKILKILKDNFCITYTGNIGKAQKFDTLIKAAIKLREYDKIKFIIIGEGSEKNNIKKIVKDKKLYNFYIFNQIHEKYINYIQKNSRALFLGLKKSYIFDRTIPSKLQQYLSIGKIIIGEINGDSKKLIIKSGSGFVLKKNSVDELSKIIYKIFFLKKKEIYKFEKNAKNFFKINFDIKKNISILENELK